MNYGSMTHTQRAHLKRGWIDASGNITPAGEEEAEARFDPDPEPDFGGDYDDFAAPEPYPGGGLI